MAVLITGATGLIGRVLTGSLIDAGLRVHVLTRRPHRAVEYFSDRVSSFEWHPVNEPVPAGALDGIDTIVHLMGEPLQGRAGPDRLARIIQSRVQSTQRLAVAAQGRKMRLIMGSSTAVYPAINKGESGTKTTPAGNRSALSEASATNYLESPLQASIAQWESAADPFRNAGGSVVSVRLGSVISRDGFLGSLLRVRSRGLDIRLDPDALIPVIALQDAVALFAWLIVKSEIDGVINGVAPTPLSGKLLNDEIVACGTGGYRLPVPAKLLPWVLGVESGLILNRPFIAPKVAMQQGFVFSHPDPVVPLKHALAQCVAKQAQREKVLRSDWANRVKWLRRKNKFNKSADDHRKPSPSEDKQV